MCVPALLTPTALAAMNVGVGVAGAVEASQVASSNRQAAKKQAALEASQLDNRQQEQAVSTRSQLMQYGLNAIKQASSNLVTQANSNVRGASPVRELENVQTQLGLATDRLQTNAEFTGRAISDQRQASDIRKQTTIIQNKAPNLFTTGLKIASSGYTTYHIANS